MGSVHIMEPRPPLPEEYPGPEVCTDDLDLGREVISGPVRERRRVVYTEPPAGSLEPQGRCPEFGRLRDGDQADLE